MNMPNHTDQMINAEMLQQAIGAVTARVAPAWPLDRLIAVNPWWGFIDLPLPQAAEQLHLLNNTTATMPLAWYQQAFAQGQISPSALAASLARHQRADSGAEFAQLNDDSIHGTPYALLTTWIDQQQSSTQRMALRSTVTHNIGQYCASWFDRGQAIWTPDKSKGLYALWQETNAHDHGLAFLTGIAAVSQRIRQLPTDPEQLMLQACQQLGLTAASLQPYLATLLFSINGWAGWCAYLAWQAKQDGGSDDHLQQLLAIRLAWDWVLADLLLTPTELHAWQQQLAAPRAMPTTPIHWIWQDALELTWQTPIHQALQQPIAAASTERAVLDAVFCIDVRSEVIRRALEKQHAAIRTHGFAGFFGLPIDYQPPAAQDARPQLPGLLKPALNVVAHASTADLSQRLSATVFHRTQQDQRWQGYRKSALGGFGFVETLGLGYVWKLVRDSLGLAASNPDGLTKQEKIMFQPKLDESSLRESVELAATILKAMSLPQPLAPWVLLVGHGSQTSNNPHAAGLNCGACCGQTGEVNARVLASLLNRADIRAQLGQHGVQVPVDTQFVAALHDTVTDEIRLFDVPAAPANPSSLQQVQQWLQAGSASSRRERAASLDIPVVPDEQVLLQAFIQRTRDWAQVRPEWGLVNNAGFIAASRQRSQQLDLNGRCFLHNYDYHQDHGHKILTLILTAPVVVAHWINLQYYSSTVDNLHWGSGDKVLHNVVGGNIGVFEGNGGDLRIGLPLQSLHDGKHWRHTPLRLSVWVEAPPQAIEAILTQHQVVANLVNHQWLHLFSLDPDSNQLCERRPAGDWRPVNTALSGEQPLHINP